MMMNLPCLMASCANFLRPICSYTECRLSFQTGSCPTERTTASYSSCLFWLLLTFLCCRDSFQWTPPLLYQLVLCMFFGTTSLKRDIKKEGVFQPPLNFTFIIFQIRNILFLTKILLVSLIYHQILNSTIQLIYPSHTSMELM